MRNATYDALSERKDLAIRLAAWNAAEFIRTKLASRWHRRAQRLARMTGLTVAQVMANLNDDADAILAADDE